MNYIVHYVVVQSAGSASQRKRGQLRFASPHHDDSWVVEIHIVLFVVAIMRRQGRRAHDGLLSVMAQLTLTASALSTIPLRASTLSVSRLSIPTGWKPARAIADQSAVASPSRTRCERS